MGMRYDEDVLSLAQGAQVPWEAIDGSAVVITGATGLIGGMLARTLIRRNELVGAHTRVVLPVRNVQKATKLFGVVPDVELLCWDAATGEVPAVSDCDYLIHCASNTDSRLMVERPVDTILATVEGTRAMLELACRTSARMCYVSSMEVYGAGSSEPLHEGRGGELDAMNVRSSYPQAKQLAETLCASYAKQHGVRVCVARLAQSFGPGIASSDRRVFAEFARCCMEGRNITLLTDGSKSNMYVYTADAVYALLLLAAKGAAGEAYNVANEDTFCSIWEMAQRVADAFGTQTKVTRVVDPEAAKRYAVSGRMWLNTTKVRGLGWRPSVGLMDMYQRMMDDWDASQSTSGRNEP